MSHQHHTFHLSLGDDVRSVVTEGVSTVASPALLSPKSTGLGGETSAESNAQQLRRTPTEVTVPQSPTVGLAQFMPLPPSPRGAVDSQSKNNSSMNNNQQQQAKVSVNTTDSAMEESNGNTNVGSLVNAPGADTTMLDGSRYDTVIPRMAFAPPPGAVEMNVQLPPVDVDVIENAEFVVCERKTLHSFHRNHPFVADSSITPPTTPTHSSRREPIVVPVTLRVAGDDGLYLMTDPMRSVCVTDLHRNAPHYAGEPLNFLPFCEVVSVRNLFSLKRYPTSPSGLQAVVLPDALEDTAAFASLQQRCICDAAPPPTTSGEKQQLYLTEVTMMFRHHHRRPQDLTPTDSNDGKQDFEELSGASGSVMSLSQLCTHTNDSESLSALLSSIEGPAAVSAGGSALASPKGPGGRPPRKSPQPSPTTNATFVFASHDPVLAASLSQYLSDVIGSSALHCLLQAKAASVVGSVAS